MILFFPGSESGSGITKKFKIRIRIQIQCRNHNTSNIHGNEITCVPPPFVRWLFFDRSPRKTIQNSIYGERITRKATLCLSAQLCSSFARQSYRSSAMVKLGERNLTTGWPIWSRNTVCWHQINISTTVCELFIINRNSYNQCQQKVDHPVESLLSEGGVPTVHFSEIALQHVIGREYQNTVLSGKSYMLYSSNHLLCLDICLADVSALS